MNFRRDSIFAAVKHMCVLDEAAIDGNLMGGEVVIVGMRALTVEVLHSFSSLRRRSRYGSSWLPTWIDRVTISSGESTWKRLNLVGTI